MLREEESQGMEIVFNVFGSQYDVPVMFPRCENFIGPKYFLAWIFFKCSFKVTVISGLRMLFF